ncbi:MAG: tripartite tricarboxylate transporter substrate binding protein, partial [Proteobacteria bacterium]|nr:tripartite tricarboxylate transporter substrate binding protein [Burkholderiales bacterium]
LLATIVAIVGAGRVEAQQKYPTRAIRLVLPFPPGGSTDIVARVVTQRLGEHWGQPVIIDNRPGASGNVAAELVARAAPDGYTLFQVNVANAIAASLFGKLNYSLTGDFVAITQLATTPYALLAHPGVPAKSVRELLQLARSSPGKLNYASAGPGSATHLSGELINSLGGVTMVHIPYKGTGAALAALLSGEADLYFAAVPSAVPMVQSGKLRVLAVSSARRASLMPQVPTMEEGGLKGFDTGTWHGVLAPQATPRELVGMLSSALVRILKEPDIHQKLVAQGLEPVGDSPEQFSAFIQAEMAKWAKLVKASGARPE